MDLKDEIIRRVEALSWEQQRQLLAYCDTFGRIPSRGESGKTLLPFSGVLDHTSAAEKREAIESACETGDAHEW